MGSEPGGCGGLPLRTSTWQPAAESCDCDTPLAPVGEIAWLMAHGLLHVMSPCGCGPELRPPPSFPSTYEWLKSRGLARDPDPPIQGRPPPYPDSAFGPGPFRYDPTDPPVGRLDLDGGLRIPRPSVYVYLSAGPATGDHGDPSTYVSCNQDQAGHCRLFRVGIDFDDPSVEMVEEIEGYTLAEAQALGCAGGLGVIQPAVSPDGSRLAFVEACVGPDESAIWRSLRVMDVHEDTGPARRYTERARIGGPLATVLPDAGPSFPDWYDANGVDLLYSQGTGIDEPNTMEWLEAPAYDTAIPTLGADSRHSTDELFSNPRSFSNPVYRRGAADRITTFGGAPDPGGGYEHMPRVHGLWGEELESFDTGDPAFTECHHPAWSPDGTEIMCTRQLDPVSGDIWLSEDLPLYSFTFDRFTGDWGNPGEVFDRIDSAALDAALGGTLPVFDASTPTPNCRTHVYKFGQWCGDADHVVLTLFCSDLARFGGDFGIFTSRVVLVNLRDRANPVFRDLTEIVERRMTGTFAGAWQGIFATCGSPGGQLP